MTFFAQINGASMRLFSVLLFFILSEWCFGQNSSDLAGSVSITLKNGTSTAPSYMVVSPGSKEKVIYKGLALSASENNVSFNKFPSISNPGNLLGPFQPGVLASTRARANSVLDENGSVSTISMISLGSGYKGTPQVYISPPSEANGTAEQVSPAFAEVEFNSNSLTLEGVNVVSSGRGYIQPPEISIEGGPCFLRITDSASTHSGTFFKILSNTDDTLELSNPANIDLSIAVQSGFMVEVFQGWTLGSLLGYEETPLYSDSDSEQADWVYILKEPEQQTGAPNEDYTPHFHNGTNWAEVLNPDQISSDTALMPDESFIIVRKHESETEISISGLANINASAWQMPPFGKKNLVCNPFPSEIMLSDLFDPNSITMEANETNGHLWLSSPNQDLADNIHVLESGTWTTYWHDGSNLNITTPAKISVRKGSGAGGALTGNDFSFTSGTIEGLSNPTTGNVVVTSTGHGLKNGFLVNLSSVTGRLTNEDKIQINEASEPVEDGYGLVVSSIVNGTWEITNCTSNTFELVGSFNNCDFIPSAQAKWQTGTAGAGYTHDVQISIRGGGGRNGRAIGKVVNGKIDKILITSGGLLYTSPTFAKIHPGGWRSISRGNAPLNDKLIPVGSGVLIERKHPHGASSMLPLLPFVNQAGN